MTIDTDTFNGNALFHGVKGLIRVADKIIVVRRDTKTMKYQLQLDLPGGGREGNESPFETLKREIRETLGINLGPDDIAFSVRYDNPSGHAQDTFFLVTKELTLDPHKINFGEKGLMYSFMTMHEFIKRPDAVEKQKGRIINYLNCAMEELRAQR